MHLIDSHAHLDMYTAEELAEVLHRAHTAGIRNILAIGIGDGRHQCTADFVTAKSTSAARSSRHLRHRRHSPAGSHQRHARSSCPPRESCRKPALHRRRRDRPGLLPCRESGDRTPERSLHRPTPDRRRRTEADRHSLPEIIRTRNAAGQGKFGPADAWKICSPCSANTGSLIRCLASCIASPEPVDHARRSLDLGFYISLLGNLTYPVAKAIREAASFAPADRILVETDAPFLAPIPLRGQRNEPAYVTHTAAALAQLRVSLPPTRRPYHRQLSHPVPGTGSSLRTLRRQGLDNVQSPRLADVFSL